MIAKMLCGAALAAVLCSPALAQTLQLGQGQMLRVSPSGQVSIMPIPTDTKMVKMMHRGSKMMKGGTVLFMDGGQIHEAGNIFIQDLRNRESTGLTPR
jgi:hypothetical protein